MDSGRVIGNQIERLQLHNPSIQYKVSTYKTLYHYFVMNDNVNVCNYLTELQVCMHWQSLVKTAAIIPATAKLGFTCHCMNHNHFTA